ncbi:glycosyltransferase family 2 protein [Shewanella decolorationis]|uniref:HAD family hydrolase n=1 Tax=Shewanella decolorationis S12 TaxID=1353536 RepID=A0ABP2Z401_9GAMM|nr:glycosyltransferase family 2 protein [Shewanella decolorationis]ESE41256.1 HAD family hydrolase [Shewanella decolorationis S12]GLR31675.1 glycosyl transferase [Shewanella decolorationis]
MISVITVVYNAPFCLEKTINSLLNQNIDRSLIEFIVIDGGSGHETINIINNNRVCIDSWVSENDAGIYDAMNKGINLSSGEWVYFLNAGDTFEKNNVLSILLEHINNITDDINMVYGSHKADSVEHKQECSLPFLISHMINHQSMIYHRSLFEHGYDLRYRFCADYAHLLSVWPCLKPKALDLCIANFDTTGVSSQASNKARMWQERLQAVWRSDLNITVKIMLSSRGVMAWPYHYLKNWLLRLTK